MAFRPPPPRSPQFAARKFVTKMLRLNLQHLESRSW